MARKPKPAPGRLVVEYTATDALVPYARNSRTHSDEQVAQIAASIREFGFTNPVLIDGEGTIIAGHGRVLASMKLGLEEVPTITLGHLTDAQRRAYVIADNRLALNAGWDMEMLAAEVRAIEHDIDQGLADFALDIMGFTDAEIADLLSGMDPDEGGGEGGDEAAKGSLAERFGVPPFTVLDARQGYWRARKEAWRRRGINEEQGRENLKDTNAQGWMQRGKDTGGSAFDPVLAELITRWFTPEGGKILDPFAGEVTKGFVAASLGYEYTGVELRPEQVGANEQQWTLSAQFDVPTPKWICGDSAQIGSLLPEGEKYDLIFTSPPYYDLEIYSKSDKDGSAFETYDKFMAWYADIFAQAVDRLNDNRFVVVKIGDVRDKRGAYYNFLGDNIAVFRKLGLSFYNEAVLAPPIGSMPMKAGRQFTAGRKLVRGHQNVLGFFKGDPSKIKSQFPAEMEFGWDGEDADSTGEDD